MTFSAGRRTIILCCLFDSFALCEYNYCLCVAGNLGHTHFLSSNKFRRIGANNDVCSNRDWW